jgi:hypothetical protein
MPDLRITRGQAQGALKMHLGHIQLSGLHSRIGAGEQGRCLIGRRYNLSLRFFPEDRCTYFRLRGTA